MKNTLNDPPECPPTDRSPCYSCEEDEPRGECPASRRSCGHHCDHSWTHESCCWCGLTFSGSL